MEQTKQYKPVKNLLSKGSTNSKTAKNDIKTFILYLAPHNLNVKKYNALQRCFRWMY